MFIGKYELNNKVYCNIYFKNKNGYEEWNKDIFNPICDNIEILDFTTHGTDYIEKKNNVEELAIDWKIRFSHYDWSYSESALIQDRLYELGKRFGLLNVFKENCIC